MNILEISKGLAEQKQKAIELSKELKNVVVSDDILQTRKRGHLIYYYKRRKRSDYSGEYLNCSREKEIKALEELNYYRELKSAAENNVEIINFIEKKISKLIELNNVFFDIPLEKRHLIEPYVLHNSKVRLKVPNKQKESPHDVNYVASNGIKVRSKSELIIIEKLIRNKVQFYYEYPVDVGYGKSFFVDFLVLNEKEEKAYFWEHLGKVDDEEYMTNALQRLEILAEQGIVSGKNLIITMEGSKHPLNSEYIDYIIGNLK